MKLKDMNIGTIIVLLTATLVGHGAIWEYKDGVRENNQQLVEMYERKDKLETEQEIIIDEYTAVTRGERGIDFDFKIQRYRTLFKSKKQEIDETVRIIADLSGKNIKDIAVRRHMLGPFGLTATGGN